MILMAYDEHWETGDVRAPSQARAGSSKLLDKRMKDLDPDHTIIALGNYGYDWAQGKPAEDVTFQDVARIARTNAGDIDFDADAENPHFTYQGQGGAGA